MHFSFCYFIVANFFYFNDNKIMFVLLKLSLSYLFIDI